MMQLLPVGNGYGFLHRADPQRPPRATMLMLNAGLIHRGGPARMNIELADHLAPHGIDLFRFDLPAVGDAPAGGVDRQQHIRQAMDIAAAANGCERFIVGGICSAADLAWRLPPLDARVQGLLLLDPCAVRGLWFRWAQLQHFASRPVATWGHMLQRWLRHGWNDGGAAPAGRDWPSQREFIDGNRRMATAGIAMYVLYTAGVTEYFLHPRQMHTSFAATGNDPRLRLRHRPDIDHILFVPHQRAEVLDDIAAWLDAWLPAAESSVAG
ncbi:hypothetical protein [Solilutibacter silvestris]|uniref:Alpha/beta hydrolase family n=1 Tax=Solilutibacter silvestris TaxID=1645665 RepID=A0A2K1PZB3_9GAMM|nr:hypothetical protein [Lysobacter silvestris]PNS08136.1 hypothetical protein Lysil_2312 [Lysobacter silvestris]